eukprot:scaffold18892_cov64-Phaeocystis_antarctica.AAC.2
MCRTASKATCDGAAAAPPAGSGCQPPCRSEVTLARRGRELRNGRRVSYTKRGPASAPPNLALGLTCARNSRNQKALSPMRSSGTCCTASAVLCRNSAVVGSTPIGW